MAEETPADSNTAPSAPTNDGAASPKTSSKDPLLASIKQFVNLTNSALSTFEQATDESSTMVVSRIRMLGTQARHIATRATTTYEHRGQYGPQIVAGSAVLVGSAIALRTGKLPAGVVAGGLGGAAAYGNVYGFEDRSATSWRDLVPK